MDNVPSSGTVLIFGSQALGSYKKLFHSLHSHIRRSENVQWVGEVLKDLQRQRDALCQFYPKLEWDSSGLAYLAQLRNWLGDDTETYQWVDPPNIVLTPVVVAIQLIEYMKILDEEALTSSSHKNAPKIGECLGLCTGVLSAIAVACSPDIDQLTRYGAAAIRLAMLVGAVVDAEEAQPRSSKASSFVMTCGTASSFEGAIKFVEMSPTVSRIRYPF